MKIPIIEKTYDKISSYLVKSRDATSVSYNRFDRGDDNSDERSPPTSIIVPPFDENDPEFKVFFDKYHCQKAALICAVFGMSFIILMFTTTFFEFDWYHHERGVDFMTLLGLILYLICGVLIHYFIIYGIKKQQTIYFFPFIVIYMFLILSEALSLFTVIISFIYFINARKNNSHPESHHHYYEIVMYDHTKNSVIISATVLTPLIFVQSIMIYLILKCRNFIAAKNAHAAALKVAERAKQQYPGIEIVHGSIDNKITSRDNHDVERGTIADNPSLPQQQIPSSFSPQDIEEEVNKETNKY
uniref:MARVEL domain-containing protein n=1 Tax=Strongyloides stercoralis TaxID=6248 RepID=A0A0K0DW20_STRER